MPTPKRKRPKGGDFPPKWEPKKEGKKLVGKVSDVREVTFDDREAQVIEIKTKDGDKFSVWINACLKYQDAEDLEEGDKITLKYVGSEKMRAFGKRVQVMHYNLNDFECTCNDDDDDDSDDEDDEDD